MSIKSLQRIAQTTDSTCGPAVLQILLDFYHIVTTQSEIIRAAGVETTVEENGIGMHTLSTAVRQLAPKHTLWYKEDSSIKDVHSLIEEYKIPVAVDWQGFFYDSLEEEGKSHALDHGHYSIISEINLEKDTITLIDPYPKFISKDRMFPIGWFKSRWWDTAEEKDTTTGEKILYYTSRLLFIVVPENEIFPQTLGMGKVADDYLKEKLAKAHLSHSFHPQLKQKNRFWSFWKK